MHKFCSIIVTSISPNYRVSEHQNCLRTTEYPSTNVALSCASIRHTLSSWTPAVCIQKWFPRVGRSNHNKPYCQLYPNGIQ